MTDDISVNHKSKLAVKPRIDQQLLGISDECLVIQHFNINLLLSMGWGGGLFFWLVGFPSFLATVLSPWIPPYGYHEDGSVVTFSDLSIVDMNWLAYILVILIMGGAAIAITLGFSYLNLRAVKKAYSPHYLQPRKIS